MDKISITCPKCKVGFTEQARKVRGGANMTCPHCKEPIAFEDGSEDENIRKALSSARKARRLANLAG